MSVGITDFAHSIRKSTAAFKAPISLSHSQQLVCAALGHKTLASFQAALAVGREPQDFGSLAHVVPDYELLIARAAELCIELPYKKLRALIDRAFNERAPATHLHHSFDALADEFQEDIQSAALSDESINSAMADANYDGIEEVYVETDLQPQLVAIDEFEPVKANGQVTLGIDLERPYAGHHVRFEMNVTMHRCGRRCFEEPEFDVVSAGLDYDWDGDGGSSPTPTTLVQELASRLRIELAEAEQLVDAEAMELTGSSGEMTYGYQFEFTNHASPELAAKLMRVHGSLKLEVEASFFEMLRGPDGLDEA